MTREEFIHKAWSDLGIEMKAEDISQTSGWAFGYFVNGVDDIVEGTGVSADLIEYDIDTYGTGKYRPKALTGIENNNGWIKIESLEDLPAEGYYEVIARDTGRQSRTSLGGTFAKLQFDYYSHYQEIVELEKPLF